MTEPPEFDPNTAEPWDDLYDPYFASPKEAEEWEGVSEFAEPNSPQTDV